MNQNDLMTPRDVLARTLRRIANSRSGTATERMRAALALVAMGDGEPDVDKLERFINGPLPVENEEEEGDLSMEEFVEGLRELMDGMPAEWDQIGRLAVVFGACIHASELGKEEARRALARFEGATDWQNAHAPGDGEEVH